MHMAGWQPTSPQPRLKNSVLDPYKPQAPDIRKSCQAMGSDLRNMHETGLQLKKLGFSYSLGSQLTTPPIMENPMEKTMKNDMETVV